MNRSNIILDFFDPENRILYGSYKNLEPDEHVRLLKEGLNLASFICDDFCILPPSAIMQCRIARRALMESSYYFDEGILRFPLRESSLDAFIEKKKNNYAWDKTDDDYSEFFAEDGPAFLHNHAKEIIKRETKIGAAIAAMVEATPFDHPLWQYLYQNYPLSVLEKIQSAPRELVERDEAISVKAIKRIRNLEEYKDIDFQIGRILQNKYFYAYIYEYGAKIISEVPIKTTDFLMEHFGPAYEYSYWRFMLKSLGLADLILKSGSKTIVQLRNTPGCFEFVNTAIALGSSVSTVTQAKKVLAGVMTGVRQMLGKKVLMPFRPVGDDNELTIEELEEISELFYSFAKSGESAYANNYDHIESSKHVAQLADMEEVDRLKQQLTPCDFSKPFVFISYNRADMELNVYKDCIMLEKMGINCWVDNANMHGCNRDSEGWKTVINEALAACSLYIPYVSPTFFDSRPCCEEVKNFFRLNKDAGILILLKSGFSPDEIITKILTYDNILQGEDANNMIKLFKANASSSGHSTPYSIDQIYRHCSNEYFMHYIQDPIFFNTFRYYGIIDNMRFPDYQSWREKGLDLIKAVSL